MPIESLTSTRAINIILISALLGYFLYDLFKNINSFKTIIQSFEVVSNNSLVPPGSALCITKNITYGFNITIQGEVKAWSDYVSPVDPSSQDFTLYRLDQIVAKCWIIKSPSNSAVIQKLPPNKNVEDMVFTYTRIFDTPDSQVKSPILVNVFDPLEPNSLFQFNRFLKLDPDINRAIHFSRTQDVYLNNTIKNDVKFNIVDEFPDPQPNNYSSTNKFTVRAVSFDIIKVKSVRKLELTELFSKTLTLLGSLTDTYYGVAIRVYKKISTYFKE